LGRAGAAASSAVERVFSLSQSGKCTFCGGGRGYLHAAVDFVADQPPNGRRFRVLMRIEKLKRECGVLQAIK
jgi:hypothetical protein